MILQRLKQLLVPPSFVTGAKIRIYTSTYSVVGAADTTPNVWRKPRNGNFYTWIGVSGGGGGGAGFAGIGGGGGSGSSGSIGRVAPIPFDLLPDVLYHYVGMGGAGAQSAGVSGKGKATYSSIRQNALDAATDSAGTFYRVLGGNSSADAGNGSGAGGGLAGASAALANDTAWSHMATSRNLNGLAGTSGAGIGNVGNSVNWSPSTTANTVAALSAGASGAGSSGGNHQGGSIVIAGIGDLFGGAFPLAGGLVGSAQGKDGLPGIQIPGMPFGWTGGSGGGSDAGAGATGGKGGDGAYGCGGGGGGAGGAGGVGGAGGKGGDGLIIEVWW